jgi:menaquinone-9 beta-reductase
MVPGRRQDYDVFIIGGGPAGLATAIAARRKGFSVAVADGYAPSIDKPCGEGMMPHTVAALRELGVAFSSQGGVPFRGIQFISGGLCLRADFPKGQGIGIRRPSLHHKMAQEAERLGVHPLWRTPVRGVRGKEIQLASGVVTAEWIIGADGTASRMRYWAGLDTSHSRRQRFAIRRHYRISPWSDYTEVHWGPRLQAYVTPTSEEEVCVVILSESREGANFERALVHFSQLRERLANAELSGNERGCVTAMYSLPCVARGNVALVGDASAGVDAITGEGLGLAFRQAQALTQAIASHDLAGYERAHRRLLRRPMYMGKLMLQLANSRWLRDGAMRGMHRAPELFERLLAIHVGHATPKDILSTGAQLGWQFLATVA